MPQKLKVLRPLAALNSCSTPLLFVFCLIHRPRLVADHAPALHCRAADQGLRVLADGGWLPWCAAGGEEEDGEEKEAIFHGVMRLKVMTQTQGLMFHDSGPFMVCHKALKLEIGESVYRSFPQSPLLP